MPISRSAEPVGTIRRWIDRCLTFLDQDIDDYAFHLHQRGYTAADAQSFRKAMRAFFLGQQLNDTAFCLCLELSGALATYFAENEDLAPDEHQDLVSFMFDCLMDGKVSVGAIANARNTAYAVTAF